MDMFENTFEVQHDKGIIYHTKSQLPAARIDVFRHEETRIAFSDDDDLQVLSSTHGVAVYKDNRRN